MARRKRRKNISGGFWWPIMLNWSEIQNIFCDFYCLKQSVQKFMLTTAESGRSRRKISALDKRQLLFISVRWRRRSYCRRKCIKYHCRHNCCGWLFVIDRKTIDWDWFRTRSWCLFGTASLWMDENNLLVWMH